MKLRFSFVMKSQIEVVLSGAQYVGKGGQNKWRVVCMCVCVCVCMWGRRGCVGNLSENLRQKFDCLGQET